MNQTAFVGIMTGIGFAIAAWSYPVVAPVLDKMLAEPYTCNIQATHKNGLPRERTIDVWSTEFKDRLVFEGFKFQKLFKSRDGEYFANTKTESYPFVQLHCVRK